MNYLLVVFLGGFLVPILAGSWRLGLIGLGLQPILLGLINLKLANHQGFPLLLQLIDLVFVRGLLVPTILFLTIKRVRISSEFDFVPTNFIYWAGLLILFGAGLWFGILLFPDNFGKALHCGSVAAGVLTAFFVLSFQSAGVGQIFAILLLENSIVLFELLEPHHLSNALQIAITLIFVLLILVFRMFLGPVPTLTTSDQSGEDKDLL